MKARIPKLLRPLGSTPTHQLSIDDDQRNPTESDKDVVNSDINIRKLSAVGLAWLCGRIQGLTGLDNIQRERLQGLSRFRTSRSAISFTPSALRKGGGQAEVVRATFKRGILGRKQEVAVKMLRYHRGMDSHKFANVMTTAISTLELHLLVNPQEFVHETELMASLSHENIIQFLGFVEDLKNGNAWMILSWEPNGNVSEFLATGKWEIPERISLVSNNSTPHKVNLR